MEELIPREKQPSLAIRNAENNSLYSPEEEVRGLKEIAERMGLEISRPHRARWKRIWVCGVCCGTGPPGEDMG